MRLKLWRQQMFIKKNDGSDITNETYMIVFSNFEIQNFWFSNHRCVQYLAGDKFHFFFFFFLSFFAVGVTNFLQKSFLSLLKFCNIRFIGRYPIISHEKKKKNSGCNFSFLKASIIALRNNNRERIESIKYHFRF